MYESTLQKSGLSSEQAVIYELLLKNGTLPAGTISERTKIKRGLVYKVLDELTAKGLVIKNEKEKILRFEASHPLRLKELAESQELEAKVAQEALSGIIGNLTSDFNLISGKPGVQYYEGDEAIRRITEDSLTADGIIYAYIDNDAVDKYMPEINKLYVQERVKRGIIKKLICPEAPAILLQAEKISKTLLECRVIKGVESFATVMQIYGNKVSYLTLDEKVKIGIIIDNPFIARMHRTLFEQLWASARPITPPVQVSGAATPPSVKPS